MTVFDISKCLLGDPVHDDEHIQLFAMMDGIINEVRNNTLNESTIQMMLQRLRNHFMHEYAFMEQVVYPRIKEHRRDHEFMIDLVERTIRQVRIGGSLAYSTMVIENMFVDHIQYYDADLQRFMHHKV